MQNRTTRMIAVAVIVLAFATAVVATTLLADDGGATHAMPDGRPMQGEQMR